MTWNKDRKQTKYGHMRREHMTHTTEPWQYADLLSVLETVLLDIFGTCDAFFSSFLDELKVKKNSVYSKEMMCYNLHYY